MDNLHKGLFLSVVVLLGYIVFLQQCKSRDCPEPEIIEVDTVANITVIDTAYYDTTRFKYLTIDIPRIIYDTIKITVTGNDPSNFDGNSIVKYYVDTVTDDTISIHYEAKTLGYLEDLKIGYRLLQPYRVDRTTTIETNTTQTIKRRFQGLYLGLDVGGNLNSFNHFTPMVELNMRKYNYNVGYNLMNESYIVGIRVKVSFKGLFKKGKLR